MPLMKLIGSRILLAIVTLLIVSLVVFAVMEVLPGDVASRILGREATAESVAQLRAQLHLDDPLVIRYLHWIGNILSGELGKSLASGRPVAEISNIEGPAAVEDWLKGFFDYVDDPSPARLSELQSRIDDDSSVEVPRFLRLLTMWRPLVLVAAAFGVFAQRSTPETGRSSRWTVPT